MNPREIAKRARTIRLETKALATLAGVDETTAQRTLGGKTVPLTTTAEKLMRAVESEERRLLAHLIALHPDCLATQERAAA